jgi:16S rRNA (uracil1498-N3)-methyltransferase
MSKYFRCDEPLSPGADVTLPGHRFVRVLRTKVGDVLTLCDPNGALWTARVAALEPFRLAVVAPSEGPRREAAHALEVWVPLLKGGRTDDLVRQLTELGVTRIVPFASARAVVRLDPAKATERQARFLAIAREAAQQCGRTVVPDVARPIVGMPTQVAPGPHGAGVFLWEEGGAPAREALVACPGRILVGPEGGLAAGEAEALEAAGWHAAWLGPRILRAETACVALAVLALSAAGEHGYG